VSFATLCRWVVLKGIKSTRLCKYCILLTVEISRGGLAEYLHRDPASRRRQRKGKSRIWDSKIWSRVPRNSDMRMIVLARVSSSCKRQTRPVVREGAPHQQTRNCLTVIKIWSWAPDGCFISRETGRLNCLSWHKTETQTALLRRPSSAIGIPYFNSSTPWLLVRKRTTLTERLPLVGEVNTNFSG
jgi:hypothetical protein